MNKNIDVTFGWLWRFAVFSMTAYVVFWLNRSGWGFLFAMFISCIITFNATKDKEK